MKKFIIYYFFFLCSIFIFLSSGVVDSMDGFAYLAVARNIYYKGEPVMQPYEYNEDKNIHMATYTGTDGKPYSPTGLGYSLALLSSVVITDIFYKHYDLSPPVHFPLESDWVILSLASLTNGIFASLMGVILVIYFVTLGLKPKQALLMSLVSLFSTNLFVYGKHTAAHMMFAFFLVLSFLLMKKYSLSHKKILLFFSSAAYGIVIITYNQTFLLSFPVLVLYYLLLVKPKLNHNSFILILKDVITFLLGLIPFIMIYIWFENTRAQGNANMASPLFFSSYVTNNFSHVPIPVFIEGLYGQLFSPGRSVFLYSPLLLIILLFWHKIRKIIKPEVIVFISMAIIYVIFYASSFSVDKAGLDFQGLWHGESSWGPRYLIPLIPFGMLIVGSIFITLSKKQKLFIFMPLAVLGLYVEILGVLMPYQIKFHDLQPDFFVNGTEYPNSVYSNLLPRYTPILKMSKKLVKLVQSFPNTLDHGIYNVKFYDGIDFPFNVGPERWRVVEGTGHISFDNKINQPVQRMAFGLINHQIGESSSSAHLQFLLNNHPLLAAGEILALRERKVVNLPIKNSYLIPNNNQLTIQVRFDNPQIITKKSQILGLISLSINDTAVNIESLDIPYLSPFGPLMTNIPYQNYGGTNKNLSKSWDIHTQIFERVPDFWWIKFLYYWDIPKQPIFLLFILNILGMIFFGIKTFQLFRKQK